MTAARVFYFLFFICAVADVYFILSNFSELRYFTKPVLMPLLMLAYFFESRPVSHFGRLLLAGLFFSWLGDVFLMFEYLNQVYFILGLVCFLTTHILYIRYFTNIHSQQVSFFKKRPVMFIAVAAYSAELVYLMWPGLGALKIPVIIYASIISIMLVCALWLYQKISDRISLLFILGAFLFVASDSMLAVDKFRHSFQYAGVLIMITYVLAQYLITKGSVRHVLSMREVSTELAAV